MKKETTGEVYFFDTESLDLLSKGIILRLRRGSSNDLTVKVRLPGNEKLPDPSRQRKGFKCEMDMSGGQSGLSYSIQNVYAGSSVPDTGHDILKQLNDGQKELLKEAQALIDWTRVKRIASIQSTDWDTRGQAQFDKLTLELWRWPQGSVLELSAKVGPDEGPSAYARLLWLVNHSGLSVSPSQRPKTNMVLEKLAHIQCSSDGKLHNQALLSQNSPVGVFRSLARLHGRAAAQVITLYPSTLGETCQNL